MVEIGNREIRYLIIGYVLFQGVWNQIWSSQQWAPCVTSLGAGDWGRSSAAGSFRLMVGPHQPPSTGILHLDWLRRVIQFRAIWHIGLLWSTPWSPPWSSSWWPTWLSSWSSQSQSSSSQSSSDQVIRNTSSESLLDQFPAIRLIGLLWTGTLWGAVDLVGHLYHNNWI